MKSLYLNLRTSAFSLAEMLVVIAIMAILAALVLPSLRSISSSTELSTSGAGIVDMLNLARQTALSSNRPVEVRFFEVPRASDPALAYRAIAIYVVGDTGLNQVGKLLTLSNNVVMASDKTFGTLLDGLPEGQAALPSLDPNPAKAFKYRHFTYRPDGSAKLSQTYAGDTWHVMLYDAHRPPPDAQTAPQNHITIQIVPDTGRPRIFQPGAR